MKTQFISMRDGTKLYSEIIDNKAKFWLVITHGVSDKSGRHHFLKDIFGDQFNYLYYDLRGHGHSDGQPQYIDHFTQYPKDLNELLKYAHNEFGLKDYILYGHSMGALITSDFLKNFVSEDLYPSLVYLSSPAVCAGGFIGQLTKKTPLPLFDLLTNLPFSFRLKLITPNNLSHDQRINDAAEADPISANGLHTKLSFEIIKRSRIVFSTPLNLKCPGFTSIGTGDKIVSPQDAIHYFTKVEKNFKLLVIEDGYHELYNETNMYKKPFIEFITSAITSILKE